MQHLLPRKQQQQLPDRQQQLPDREQQHLLPRLLLNFLPMSERLLLGRFGMWRKPPLTAGGLSRRRKAETTDIGISIKKASLCMGFGGLCHLPLFSCLS